MYTRRDKGSEVARWCEGDDAGGSVPPSSVLISMLSVMQLALMPVYRVPGPAGAIARMVRELFGARGDGDLMDRRIMLNDKQM
jgi:hypothetical protein